MVSCTALGVGNAIRGGGFYCLDGENFCSLLKHGSETCYCDRRGGFEDARDLGEQNAGLQ